VTSPSQRAPWVAIALLATLAGAYLRVYPIATRPLWYDEAFTWYVAEERAYRQWLAWHSREPKHPPLSFIAVALSTKAFGSKAEWAVRLPGVTAGVLMVPAMYVLGTTVAGPPAGALAAALSAVAPNMVDQGQQARMFSMLALLEIIALAGVLTLLERGEARMERREAAGWIAVGTVLAAAFWTNQLAIAVWAGIGVGVLAWRALGGSRARTAKVAVRLALMFGIACVLSAPGIRMIVTQAIEGSGEVRGPSIDTFGIAREVWKHLVELAGGLVPAVLLYSLAAAGLFQQYRQRRPAAFVLGAVAVFAAAILFPLRKQHPLLAMRYLSAFEPAVFVAAAVAVAAARGRARVARAVAFALVCGFALRAVLRFEQWYIPQRSATAYATLRVRGHLRDGDLVVFHPQFNRIVGYYYGLPKNHPLHAALFEDPMVAQPETLRAVPRPDRLWFIGQPRQPGPAATSIDEQRAEVRAFARWYGHAKRGDAIAGRLRNGGRRALVLRFDANGIRRVGNRAPPSAATVGRY
jgi:hypothetical protein